MKPKLWIGTELFWPEETSTAFILTKIANRLSEKYTVNVVSAEAVYDKNSETDPDFSLKDEVKIHRLQAVFLDKNSLFFRIFRFFEISFKMFFFFLKNVKKGETIFTVTNPAPFVVLCAFLKKIKNCRWVLLVHDVFPENTIPAGIIKNEKSLQFRFFKSVFDWAYYHADTIVVLGRDMKEVIAAKTGTSDNIEIIENWGDTENIYPIQNDISTGKTVFQYAGNLGRVQGLLDLLEVIKLSNSQNLEFHFIGDGAVKPEMMKYVTENELQNVKFLNTYKRNEQNKILNACDVAIVTLSEGMFGLGVPSKSYNILAAGKPILFIGDEKSEIAQLINEKEIGFVFGNKNKEQLIRFFSEFDDFKQNLKTMGNKAREVAIRDYSEERILDRFYSYI